MTNWIERALNLRRGDWQRGILLCLYLFLIISSYVVGKVARDALFLARFKAVQLPYADIASALLVALVVAAYMRLGRWMSLRNLLLAGLVFFELTCALFWALAHYYHPYWLFPVFYVWVGIFGVLAPTQVWTLANYVLTTREAKRIFGLVGGGAIAGWIFAGFFSKTIAKAFGTESLLLGMALFIAACPPLVFLIWRSGQIAAEHDQPGSTSDAPRHLLDSLRVIFASRYLRAIAAVICISSFVTTLTGWQFKAIAKQYFVNKDALAVFFGDFNLFAGIVALVLQLVLTSRYLRRFGVGAALFILPLVVLFGSAGVLALGTLSAIIMLKGTDQVLRYSIDKSTAELLYLPLPTRVKLQVKWFIDTVVWRFGDGLAGITVLVFATYLHLTARQLSAVAMLLVGAWLVAVYIARQQYVVTLGASIREHRVDAEQASAPVLDRVTTDLLASKLTAADPQEILYALSLFEVERSRSTHPVIRSLLEHPAAEVRQRALAVLSANSDKAVLPQVKSLLRDPDLRVRTEALLYLSHHTAIDPLQVIDDIGNFADFSVRSAVVAYLARPGEAQNLEAAQQILEAMVGGTGPGSERERLEAARLLGILPDVFDPLLHVLISDPNLEVSLEAIRSTGKLRKRRLVPDLLDRLADSRMAPEIANALQNFGDPVVGTLRDYLGDTGVPIQVRRIIPSILLRIGTPTAERVLMENLLERDTTLRFEIISALNKLHHLHPEIESDAQIVETVLAAEILGHYRSYQILHMLGTAADSDDPAARGLRDSMQQELERIFRLLALLYPHMDVHNVYLGLQSKNVSVYDNALELIDSSLKTQLRKLLVPLLDGRITVAERVQLANRLVRNTIDTQEQAVAALVASDDPWLKACGAYAIGTFGLKSLESELADCLQHTDTLLRETARVAKVRLKAAGS